MQIYDILIVDNDPQLRAAIENVARSSNFSFHSTETGHEALGFLEKNRYRVLVSEISLPRFSGLQLLEWTRNLPVPPEFVAISSMSSVELAVTSLKMGAFDYLTKPFDNNEKVAACLRHALEKFKLVKEAQAKALRGEPPHFEGIIGQSPKMKLLFEMLTQVASSESSVLILGESGTGKELVAKALHKHGSRKDKPFVVINCAAMPESLLESELFGYMRGSFTGAANDKQGLFEAANGGTVFLDEIGELTLSTQVKLLRVLQEGEIRRVGDNESRFVDVRIMAATNRDLTALISQGLFREDLFYRLNVINITLPPLRERTEDIIPLSYHFLRSYGSRTPNKVESFSVDALQALQNYAWPGNVRELENVIERTIVLSHTSIITAKNLPAKILSSSFYKAPSSDEDLSDFDYKEAKKRALNIFNRSYIISLLQKTGGNITAAADKAGMDRSNFRKILRKYRIEAKLD
ncbi:sigma-54 dependent transcriptional regulator [bacterium]|nr:sigma-54 dependent transcriptional regulator [bacterium]